MVNLAGESCQGLWTAAKKKSIRASRVDLTHSLVAALPHCGVRVLVSASTTGIYGNRGDDLLSETAARGTGFLADVCQEWEDAALSAKRHGVRVTLPRIGFVLDAARTFPTESVRP